MLHFGKNRENISRVVLRVYSIVALCAKMEQGNQHAVSASTASSSQNSLTCGVAASSSQNSLKGSGADSSSKNSMTSGGGDKVAVTKRKRSVLTLERKLEIISEVNPLVPELFGRARKNLIFYRGIEHYRFIFFTRFWLGKPHSNRISLNRPGVWDSPHFLIEKIE